MYQKELLQQIEERKNREKEEKARKKQEDLLELQRIEREIAKEREILEAQNQPKKLNKPEQVNTNIVEGIYMPKPKGQRNPAPNLNSDQNLIAKQINNEMGKEPVAFNTNISKEYLAQQRNAKKEDGPNNQNQADIPLMEVVSQVTDLETPEVPVVKVEPTISRQYIQSTKQPVLAKPLTVSTVRREVQGELNRQLANLQQADGILYKQIDQKFEEGFGELRQDLQRVNKELIDNLERIKRETKEALISKEKALQELETIKREMDKPKMNYQFQKPFGGIVQDEIDDLIKRYSSKEPEGELNEFRVPRAHIPTPQPTKQQSNFNNQNPSHQFYGGEAAEETPLRQLPSRNRDFRQDIKPNNRFQSQPIKYPASRKEEKEEAMYGSINLDVKNCY